MRYAIDVHQEPVCAENIIVNTEQQIILETYIW